jgi:hypothetical protein
MHNCIGQSLPGSVDLRHPPDGRQQLADQFCLGDKIIHASGQHRLPVGVASVVQSCDRPDARVNMAD